MHRSSTLLSVFAVLAGLFFLAQGVWGLQSQVTFGVFSTNRIHALIHIAFGVTAVVAGLLRSARTFSLAMGFVLLVVGILRFIPGTDDLMVELFNVNPAVACLNIGVGITLLMLAFPVAQPAVKPSSDRRRRALT